MQFKFYINYLFLAVAMLWPVIQALFLPIGGSGQVQLFFASLALLTSLRDRRFRNNFKMTPVFVWLIWVVYSTVNWKIVGMKQRIPDWSFISLFIVQTYLVLIITLYELQKNSRRTTRFLCVVFFVYIVMGLFFQGPVAFNVERGTGSLGNDLPLVACSALFVSAFGYRQGYVKTWVFILFFILCVVSSLYVAERKTFVVTIVIAIFTIIPVDSLKKPIYWIPIVLFSVLLYWGIGWIIDNTLVGARFAMVTEEGSFFTDNKYLAFLGDRAAHYEGGWPLFLEHPLTGIGLRNYPTITMTEHPLHTEYMVQLTEGGIIGSLLFLIFSISIMKRLYRARINPSCNKQTWSVCFGEMLSLFLLCFITWTYDSPHYFIALAIVITFSNQYYYKKLQ